MLIRVRPGVCGVLLWVLSGLVSAALPVYGYADPPPITAFIPVDARPLSHCIDSSVPGSLCLPAADFHAERHGLASFRDIVWAFGTAGLDAARPVLVFADEARDRDAVAALLYLAGQAEVWRWPGSVAALQEGLGIATGQARGIVRSSLYTGVMRDHLLALAVDVDALRAAGWNERHVSDDATPLNSAGRVLLTADDSLTALAAFARHGEEGPAEVKVMIDPPATIAAPTRSPPRWSGVVLLIGATLLFAMAWRRKEVGS